MKWKKRYRQYESEFEQFLDELKRQHPEIEDEQREAHAMWWDRPPLEQEELARDKMFQPRLEPYVHSWGS
jgi:hypothetical protein